MRARNSSNLQRAVVERARQAEPVLDQREFARAVALVHAVELRNRDVGLVDDAQEVLAEVVDQRVRRLARVAPVEVARVVLDAVAVAHLLEHLEVVARAHLEPLRLEQLALGLEFAEPLVEFLSDAGDGASPISLGR